MMSSDTVPTAPCAVCASVDGRFSDFIEQGMSLAIEHAVTLLDGGQTDGLGQWLLPVPVDLKKVRPHV